MQLISYPIFLSGVSLSAERWHISRWPLVLRVSQRWRWLILDVSKHGMVGCSSFCRYEIAEIFNCNLSSYGFGDFVRYVTLLLSETIW